MTKILIVEDERDFAKMLKRCLEQEGICVEVATNFDEGLDRARYEEFEVVLTDLYLGGGTALDLLDGLKPHHPHLPVIIMTAKHTTETAIEATRRGAYDYFPKPDALAPDNTSGSSWPWAVRLSDMIEAAAESKRLTTKVRLPNDTTFELNQPIGDRMVGRSLPMQDVFKAIGRFTASDVTVLIRGETGTGKELAARALYSHSDRAQQPFISVNSAAIPEKLLESELFGHERGAFTDAKARRIGRFEQAQRGTIFLDEIGDMSFPLQQKLLRVLQEKTIERVGGKDTIPVDVRVITATHRNLELAVHEGDFRQDLYFRLNIAAITLPALRERPEDVPDLVHYFLRKHGPDFGSPAPLITPEAMQVLQQQPWPGNVRHLRNVVRKGLLLARGLAIDAEVVRAALAQMAPPSPAANETFAQYVEKLLARARRGELENVRETVAETVDRELYTQAIQRTNGDQSKAARWLGVSRPTMLERLRRFGVHPADRGQGQSAPERR